MVLNDGTLVYICDVAIIDVKVEKIQSISEKDIHKEGFTGFKPLRKSKRWFFSLWDSFYEGTEYSIKNNPYVWVVEFKKLNK